MVTRYSFLAVTAVIIVAVFGSSTQAATLAAWDSFDDSSGVTFNADTVATGFDASFDSTGTFVSFASSTDTTYGLNVPGAADVSSAFSVTTTTTDTMTFTLTNNAGTAFNIENFHLDYARSGSNSRNEGPADFTLTYISGGLAPANTVIGGVTGLSRHITGLNDKEFSDYPDHDFSISDVLDDFILASGESAEFTLTFANADGSSKNSFVDNVAFTGTEVPEPTTAAALLTFGSMLICRRKR